MSFPVHTHTMIVQMDATKLNIHNTDSAGTSSLLISVPPSCWGSSEPWEPIFTLPKACVLTPHPAGTGAPWANWLQVRWMAENNSLSLSCAAFCCFSSLLWSPWSQPNAGLHWGTACLQQGWAGAAARTVPHSTASFPPSLPETKKQRQEPGTPIHQKCKSF